MRIAIYTILQQQKWRFDAEEIWRDAMSIQWPDRYLLDRIVYIFRDYGDRTPWVITASNNIQSERNDAEELLCCIYKEITKDWLSPPSDYLPTIPFRIIPGRIVPKKESKEGKRLEWNASWPLPESYAGVVR